VSITREVRESRIVKSYLRCSFKTVA